MVNVNFIEYLKVAIRARIIPIAAATTVLCCLSVVVLRYMPAEFVADVKVFAGLPGTTNPLAMGMQGVSGSMFAAMERDILILSQESIIFSEGTFQFVRSRISGKNAADAATPPAEESLISRAIDSIKLILFGSEYLETQQKWRKPEYENYKSRLSFSANLDAGNFVIKARDRDPEIAVRTAGLAAEAVIEKNIEIANQRWQSISSFLKKKLEDTRGELEQSSEKIAQFARDNNYFNNDAILASRFQRFLAAEERRVVAEQEFLARQKSLVETDKSIQSLTARANDTLLDMESARTDAISAEIRSLELAHARSSSAKESAAIRERIESLRSGLAQSLKNESAVMDIASIRALISQAEIEKMRERVQLEGAKKRMELTTKHLDEELREIKSLPGLQSRFAEMLVTHTQLSKLAEVITQSYLNAMIQGDVRVSSFFVIEQPQLRTAFFGTGKMRLLAGMLVLCVACGVLMFAGKDYIFQVVHLRQQLSGHTSGEYIGSIQSVKGNMRLNLGDPAVGSRVAAVLARKAPLMPDQQGRATTILFTSMKPRAGKSVSTIFIASSLSSKGYKVLLIDADYRAQTRNIRSYVSDAPRLSAVQVFPYDSLVVQAESSSSQGGNLLITSFDNQVQGAPFHEYLRTKWHQDMKALAKHFDFILVDSAPTAFSDSLELAAIVDAVVICCPESNLTIPELDSTYLAISDYRHRLDRVFTVLTVSNADEGNTRIIQNYYQTDRRRAA